MNAVSPIKQFLRCESQFMGYLMAMTRNFEAAEEIFQNAAVVVMEKAQQNEPIRDFRAWAKEVVRRQALLYFREARQRRSHLINQEMLEQISISFDEDDTEDVTREQEVRALRRCLESMQDQHRHMLALRYEKRDSFEVIGKAVGSTAAAVQRAISRARMSLLRCIQKHTDKALNREATS